MKNPKNIQRLLKKISHHNGRTFCGYFTPDEIIWLVKNGATPTLSDIDRVEWSKESLKNGNSSPGWFYFTINQALEKKIQF